MILSPAVVTQFADAGRKLAQHKIQLLYIKESAVHHGRGANQTTPNTVCVGVVNYMYKPAVTSKLCGIVCTSIFTQFNYYYIYRLAVVSPYVGMVQKQDSGFNQCISVYISSLGNKIILTFKITLSSLMPAPVCNNYSI